MKVDSGTSEAGFLLNSDLSGTMLGSSQASHVAVKVNLLPIDDAGNESDETNRRSWECASRQT